MTERKPGRPEYVPTAADRKIVGALGAHGVAQRAIAAAVGCDEKTLRKHYRAELDDAHDEVEAAAGAAIVRAALRGDWRAAKFWLQTHSKDDRWRRPHQHQIAGEPDAPPIRFAVADMTDDEIRDRLAELRRRPVTDDPASSVH